MFIKSIGHGVPTFELPFSKRKIRGPPNTFSVHIPQEGDTRAPETHSKPQEQAK